MTKTLEIQYIHAKVPDDIAAASNVTGELNEMSWNLFEKFSRITKFARDAANHIIQTIDQAKQPVVRSPRPRKQSDLPAFTGVEETADRYFLLVQKDEEQLKIPTIEELATEIDFELSYEMINVPTMFSSRSLRSTKTPIDEEQLNALFDSDGHLRDSAQFKQQLFTMVNI